MGSPARDPAGLILLSEESASEASIGKMIEELHLRTLPITTDSDAAARSSGPPTAKSYCAATGCDF